MNEPERSALWLREVAGLSHADASFALGVSGGPSTLRWTRARSSGLDALLAAGHRDARRASRTDDRARWPRWTPSWIEHHVDTLVAECAVRSSRVPRLDARDLAGGSRSSPERDATPAASSGSQRSSCSSPERSACWSRNATAGPHKQASTTTCWAQSTVRRAEPIRPQPGPTAGRAASKPIGQAAREPDRRRRHLNARQASRTGKPTRCRSGQCRAQVPQWEGRPAPALPSSRASARTSQQWTAQSLGIGAPKTGSPVGTIGTIPAGGLTPPPTTGPPPTSSGPPSSDGPADDIGAADHAGSFGHSDHPAADHPAADHQAPDHGATHHQASYHCAADNCTALDRAADHRAADHRRPPTTAPPSTEPPTTEPPTTAPPVTDPPITLPPITLPPITLPLLP